MTKKQEGGKIEGGQVFILSKNIKNDGQIVSYGENAKTHIETEDYSGGGSVESHSRIYKEEHLFRKYVREIIVGITVVIMGGLALYYIFGIK